MSVFNPEEQNRHFDSKIVAGMERLSHALRALLWEHAKTQQLSPIQIQLLIFIRYHSANKSSVSYLAREFHVTKPTISDAIRVLEQKGLVRRVGDQTDNRRHSVALTAAGKKVATDTEDFIAPFTKWVANAGQKEKEALWQSITGLIRSLNEAGWISVQRHCYSCTHYMKKGNVHFCTLLNEILLAKDIRIDCPEHVAS